METRQDNNLNNDLSICIPLADSNLVDIKHLPVMSAFKTLGSMMCPACLNKVAIKRMQLQGQE
jgi:hypothetical protein